MKKIVNLTPHVIKVRTEAGTWVFMPSGVVARVAVDSRRVGDAEGIPIYLAQFGSVEGLPDPEPDTLFLVSSLVGQASKRSDLVAPDTGPTAVREQGQVVAVTRLQRF